MDNYFGLPEQTEQKFENAEIESTTLGVFITFWEKTSTRFPELCESDFAVSEHRAIYNCIKHLAAVGKSVELMTVDETVCSKFQNKQAEILPKLVACSTNAVGFSTLSSYITILKELAARRYAISVLEGLLVKAKQPEADVGAIADALRDAATNMAVGRGAWVPLQDVIVTTYTNLDDVSKGKNKPITTGLNSLDAMIGGFYKGEVTVIGARPGVGKSLFAMNVAMEAAKAGNHVCVCSREMSDIQYGQRILSRESLVDGMKIRKGQIDDKDWDDLSNGMMLCGNLPVEFVFTIQTIEDLRGEVQEKVNHNEIDLLIIDYLQLMRTQAKYENENLRVAAISRAVKSMAMDFKIPILLLSQVKRPVTGTRCHMPNNEDLRDSGAIEQDADGIIFLHNPESKDDDAVLNIDKDAFEAYKEAGLTYQAIGVTKQRNGCTGRTAVVINTSTMMYTEIERRVK